eukprot:TRINITY_DN2847_c0_g1_i3.p1 TRINITY_DN2847_c0_g1~~TRINITY_DN2847_c0_g1_i3.p1  ORF type:complete len:291 (-),score=49.85 TRINITY_DN2847_c0_g1_i3:12-884(-)
MTDLSIELLVDKRCIVGEGPIWHNTAKVLLWVDIEGKQVFVYEPKTKQNKTLDLDQMVGTIVPRKNKPTSAVVALHKGLAFLDLETGKVEPICSPETDISLRFNDGKCDPAGRLWAGTMAINEDLEPQGSLYCLFPDLTIKKRENKIGVSNGICWSHDKKKMYFIDSVTKKVDVYDYNNETGEITNRKTFTEISDGYPDGSTLDEHGNLWVAIWGGSNVSCFDHKDGKLIRKVYIPGVTQVSACAFGGDNLDELYVTTASRGKPNEPQAGSLFVVRGLGVKGVPSFEFDG